MRLPQFTIRDLMWLVLVAGLALGWLVDHRTLKEYGDRYWAAFDFLSIRIGFDGYKATLAGDRLTVELPGGGTEITTLNLK
jgi:hypothetical protein